MCTTDNTVTLATLPEVLAKDDRLDKELKTFLIQNHDLRQIHYSFIPVVNGPEESLPFELILIGASDTILIRELDVVMKEHIKMLFKSLSFTDVSEVIEYKVAFMFLRNHAHVWERCPDGTICSLQPWLEKEAIELTVPTTPIDIEKLATIITLLTHHVSGKYEAIDLSDRVSSLLSMLADKQTLSNSDLNKLYLVTTRKLKNRLRQSFDGLKDVVNAGALLSNRVAKKHREWTKNVNPVNTLAPETKSPLEEESNDGWHDSCPESEISCLLTELELLVNSKDKTLSYHETQKRIRKIHKKLFKLNRN